MNLWEAMGAVRAGKNVRFHVVTPGGVLALTSKDLERTEFHLVDEPATSPSNLPFAAAMALDPSDVEVKRAYGWVELSCVGGMKLDELRVSEFRRARPRRSRVQEMAEQAEGAPDVHARERAEHYGEAIRAVCEYLRTSEAGHMVNHDLPGQVEREFLEPR